MDFMDNQLTRTIFELVEQFGRNLKACPRSCWYQKIFNVMGCIPIFTGGF